MDMRFLYAFGKGETQNIFFFFQAKNLFFCAAVAQKITA